MQRYCSMGIKERKERHREDLKQRILDAAKKLFMKHGYEATTIRKIAAEIEFSPTTIYLYYKDKNDMLYALHQEGFLVLGKQMQPLVQVDHPFERLKAMGREYLRFALENSDFYELMFVMKEPLQRLEDHCGPDQWEEGVAVFDFLLQTVQQCMELGYFKGHDPQTFSLWVWSAVHGLCTLHMHGHLGHVAKVKLGVTEQDDLMPAAFVSFIRFLDQAK